MTDHTLFAHEKPVIGMIHLPRFPKKYQEDRVDEFIRSALSDARKLEEAGIDGVIVENYGDAPFSKKVSKRTVSMMTFVCKEIIDKVDIPVGINVLRNDWEAALSISSVMGLPFIRINVLTGLVATDQGLIEGEPAELQDFKRSHTPKTEIWADVHVKHGTTIHPEDIADSAEEVQERGKADRIIVTGKGTGQPIDIEELKRMKKAVDIPVIAGSGVNTDNIHKMIEIADGVIVGTYLKEDGIVTNPVSSERVKELMSKIGR